MRKLGLIMLVAVMALGIVGIGYGMWSDEIVIGGKVDMSDVSAIFQQAASNDPQTAYNSLPSTIQDPTTIGSWALVNGLLNPTCWSGARLTGTDNNTAFITVSGQGTDNLSIAMYNAYLGYRGSAACTILNTGKMPIIIDDVTTVVTPVTTGNGAAASDVTLLFSGALVKNTQIEPTVQILGAVYFQWNKIIPNQDYAFEVVINLSSYNKVNQTADWSQKLRIKGVLVTVNDLTPP